jgi:hypothetical protein
MLDLGFLDVVDGGLSVILGRFRVVPKLDVNGKVIGTDIRKHLQFDEPEVGRMKHVVQRIAEQRIAGVKGVVYSAPNPRI